MRKDRRVRAGIGVIAVLMVAALLPITGAAAQTVGDPGMFTAVADGRAYTPPAEVMRHRTVAVDMGTLFTPDGKAKSKATIGEVTFNLFPDVTFTGRVRSTTRDKFARTWSGDLTGVAGGYFYMVVADGAFAAHFASAEGIYEVKSTGDGGYRVVQIDQSKFVDHPPGSFDDPIVGEVLSDADLRAMEADGRAADSGAIIDILVVYTPAAKVAAGGLAAMKALIALAVTETNQGYQQSGVATRLRLVHIQQVKYTETDPPGGAGVFDEALNDLLNGTDGLAPAHTARNTYGADMVGLIIDDFTEQYCGLAAGILPGESWAYQVTDQGCATGYYSFGHEFGHLQGARHDTLVDPTKTPYAYGHGWTNPPDHWRTVMAYDNACASSGGCTRLQYWSNPTNDAPPAWGGDPMGNVRAQNYKVLNNTAFTVANWRKSKGADFNSTFKKNAIGWSSVTGTWARTTTGWFWSRGVKNKVASVVHTGTYGDFTFEARVKRLGCALCANKLIVRGKSSSLNADKDWLPGYMFHWTNDGEFSVYKLKGNGAVVVLKGWTPKPAINAGINKVKVVAVGSTLKFYINNSLMWSGTDAQLVIGQVGIGFFRNNTAGNKMLIDWARLTTTATADLPADLVFDEGVEVEGTPGEVNVSH